MKRGPGDPHSWGTVTGGPRRGQARPSRSGNPRSLTALSRAPCGESSSKANVYRKRLFLEDCLVWCLGRHSTPTRPTSELQTETAAAGPAGCGLLHPADPSPEGCCCLALAYPENPRDFCGASPSARPGLTRGCQHTHSILSIWKAWQSRGAPPGSRSSLSHLLISDLELPASLPLSGEAAPALLHSLPRAWRPGSSGLSSPNKQENCHPPRGQAQGSGKRPASSKQCKKKGGGGDKGSNKRPKSINKQQQASKEKGRQPSPSAAAGVGGLSRQWPE